MKRTKKILNWRRAPLVLSLLTACLIVFGFYLWSLFIQLDHAFSTQNQFVPTRIYSDVAKITPSLTLNFVESKLKTLNYNFQTQLDDGVKKIEFTLHDKNYPDYLLPENLLPQYQTPANVTLLFDGSDKDSLLQAIKFNQDEVQELYLEPELIATLSGAAKEIREFLKLSEIPAPVWQAIIAVEDQRFLEHKGIDPRGFARMVWVNLRSLSLAQGGSTITQQLVKNLLERKGKNVFRKINELFLSILLELRYDKELILERYLNEVNLGQVGALEVHGVSEGAQHFFGKKLPELNLAEIALLAGLIKSPFYYSPYTHRDRAMDRQKLVLRKMVETGQIAEGEAQEALKETIRLAPPQNVVSKAPYFSDFVKAELMRHLKDRMGEREIIEAGFKVFTTLDLHINQMAQKAVSSGIQNLETQLKIPTEVKLEGALAAVDQSNGYIRALIGGRNYATSNFNRILNMKRQVGSTFKPLVYLTAFDKGYDILGIPYSPGHIAEDAPWKLIYDHKKQTWLPKNYEKEYFGWITYRKALAHSVNTVAAKLGIEVGLNSIIDTARKLGVESELLAVPSLSLGVAELSPIELLRVYSTIANHGVQDEITVIRGITQNDGNSYARFEYHPKEVFSAASCDLLTDMMTSVFTEGTASSARKLGFERPASGKTGTTSEHRDAWFAGFTPHLTTVVWVGADQALPPKTKISLTGANSALPIWVNFMNEALQAEPPTLFSPSPYLTTLKIDQYSGNALEGSCPDSQALVDKFIIGKEPKKSTCEHDYPMSIRETTLE